jgi:NADH-quinone oxidoreductase subunit N
MNELLHNLSGSLSWFAPELILLIFLLLTLTLGLLKIHQHILLAVCSAGFIISGTLVIQDGLTLHEDLFNGMLSVDGTSAYLKILIDISGLLTCLLSVKKPKEYRSEYFLLLFAIALGGHLLVMSTNFIMIFLSIELISISSYVIAGFAFTKSGSEGSLKYFLFGAVASAVMLYGFSILYGITGTIDFASQQFINHLIAANSPFAFSACIFVLAGFLYKIAAAPMHVWAPDVYEAAPVPALAFLSVAPKISGLGVLFKFALAVNLFGQSTYDWQAILCGLAILTLTIGNFSALRQKNPKRMMAYSSIAQSGFLMVGVAAFLPQGIHFMLFYATVYMLMNFLVFLYLDFFENRGIMDIPAFQGTGKTYTVASIFLLIGLISLTGLPPTSGFTGKLFIFTALWQSYELTGKSIVLWLLIFGLLNTVVSLFYYLRIPYFAFLKSGEPTENENFIRFENLLGLILVLLILILFFYPALLMGWINKINFVL